MLDQIDNLQSCKGQISINYIRVASFQEIFEKAVFQGEKINAQYALRRRQQGF